MFNRNREITYVLTVGQAGVFHFMGHGGVQKYLRLNHMWNIVLQTSLRRTFAILYLIGVRYAC